MGDEGKSKARSVSLRTVFEHDLSERARLRAGADATIEAFSTELPRYVDPDDPEVRSFAADNPSRTDRTWGAWSDVVLEPAPGVQVTPGLRIDLYQQGAADAFALEPRISARFRAGQRLTLIHAYGLVHQPPAFAVPLPGRTAAELDSGLQQAFQTSAGAELRLGRATKASLTLFHNAFLAMTDGLASGRGGPPGTGADQRSHGSAYGLELYLYRPLTRALGGFVSYTLSRSMRSLGRERFPNAFDRTHVLNAALGYDLGRRWRAGGRVVFYTGVPDVPERNGLIQPLRSSAPARTDPFFRLDVRLEKRWDLSEQRWLAFVTEVMNATLGKETFGGQDVGPITIPSIGLEAGF
jgi:hypothetical protein